jgi:transcriptional regulator with XRE-family HTH domain
MLSFGERIGLLRRRQAMTQRELGEEAGIHWNTIARLERGKLTDLPGKAVARVAQALGTTTDYLLGLSEQDTPPKEVSPTKRPRRRTAASVA